MTDIKKAIELKGVSAGYGKETVLRGIDLSFDKGKLTSIIGVNGCGKSTLLKTAIGIIERNEGEIFIDGIRISDMKRNEIAKKVAYLSQGKSTPDMTVMQTVLHGRFVHLGYPRRYSSRDRELAYSSMERVGIAALAEKPMYALSGGMRQMAYIAMALAQETDYILLDEPTTYLDVGHQHEVLALLRELADGGKGIVAVMHDLALAFTFSDEIAVLGDGGHAAKATPDELSDSSVVRQMFGVSVERIGGENKYYLIKR